jgi:hypothetical protein
MLFMALIRTYHQQIQTVGCTNLNALITMLVTSMHSQCLYHFTFNFSKLKFNKIKNKPVLTNSTCTTTNTACIIKRILFTILLYKSQQDAHVTEFILSDNCSTCFGHYYHPSSGAQNNCNYSITLNKNQLDAPLF